MKSVVVSIVTFNGTPYLKKCLDSVFSQTYEAVSVCLLDNGSVDGTAEFVSNNYPQAHLISSRTNLGFARGHNEIIRRTQSEYVLALNQDALLSPTFIDQLVRAVDEHPKVGIAGGKLYSLRTWSSDTTGTSLIDMTWLDIEKKRRQVCYLHAATDTGEPALPRFAFAMDGAAMMLRRAMLDEINIEGEFFDEDFFAGKEDLDISWRAQLYGWKCLYVPSAVGYHLRTFTPKDKRTAIPETLKAGSIRNRYLLMIKNDRLTHILRHLHHIALYDLQIIAYVLLKERSSLKGYAEALRLIPKALKKRRIIMAKRQVSDEYILSWFR
jgi:GT2 family glycosyltransferase